MHTNCKTEAMWVTGSVMKRSLKMNTISGLSGNVQFDSFGERKNLTIFIVEKLKTQLELVCLPIILYLYDLTLYNPNYLLCIRMLIGVISLKIRNLLKWFGLLSKKNLKC